jgi:hypothetical protein
MPVTVVGDGPRVTLLYLQPGTAIKQRTLPSGTPIPRSVTYEDRMRLPHIVGDGTWTDHHALVILQPGLAHDVRLLWAEHTWEFRGWYVNLQARFTRVSMGFDTADHVMDIVVRPDGTWMLKDEDELAAATSVGRFSATETACIHAEAETVITTIHQRAWPFDNTLIDWRPDPSWPIPPIPRDWAQH